MTQPTKQTPFEKLLAEKERIRQQSQKQEQKLNEGLSYLQDNAGSLLLSGVSALLFSGSATAKKNKALPASEHSQAVHAPTTSLGLADFLPIGKMMIPVLWELAQPLIITWCIRRLKKAFSGKKRA